MQIQNRFEVPMPPAAAWAFLMDIPATVPCFPGAELVEKIDDDHYKGRITVKLGPLTMVFNGKLRIDNRDEAKRSATVNATWTEARGRGNAVTVTHFAMRDNAGSTAVDVDTDVQLAGQVAQYGRAAGMISDISAQLISRFAENLRMSIDARAGGESVAEGARPRSEISGLSLIGRAVANRIKGQSS
jgi:carbon monoxide dehydrogenase subunit G